MTVSFPPLTTVCSFAWVRWALAAALLLRVVPSAGQVLDTSFGVLDSRTLSQTLTPTLVMALGTDSAGRTLVGGKFDRLGRQVRGKLVCLLPSGAPDTTFGGGGIGPNGQVLAILPLPRGQWLIGGTFTRYDGRYASRVARLHANGTLDTTFRLGGTGLNDVVQALAVDGQGRLLVGGRFTRCNGVAVPSVVRLLPSGAPDAGFSPPLSNTTSVIEALAVDSADRVLVGGVSVTAAGNWQRLFVRLLPSGARDLSFVLPNSSSPYRITCLRALPGSKILVGGFLASNATPNINPGVRRFNADGSLDLTFVAPFTNAAVLSLLPLPSGQVLIGGYQLIWPGAVDDVRVRLLQPDGTINPTFAPPPIVNIAVALAPGPNGAVRVGGDLIAPPPKVGIIQFTSTGLLDSSFRAPIPEQYATVNAVARQSADRLLVRGNFSTVHGQAAEALVRLHADGSPDSTFQHNLGRPLYDSPYSAVAVDAADRVLVTNLPHVYRLLPDGQPDPTFDDGAGIANPGSGISLHDLRVQPDGRILVCGAFSQYDSITRANVARLLPNGAVDPSFVPPPVGNVTVTSISLLSDGSMLLRCEFNGIAYWVDAAGRPLPAVNNGRRLTGDVVALPDTSILVFTTRLVAGEPVLTAVKLRANGQRDPRFTLATGLEGKVVHVWPDGRLLFQEATRAGGELRRLTALGGIDSTFAPIAFGTGYFNEMAESYVFQSTGDLVIGGSFNSVDGALRPSLARLTNIPTGLTADAAATRPFDVFPNPAATTLTLRRATAAPATATLVDVLGRTLRQWPLTAAEQTVPLADVPAGTYVVRVVGSEGVSTRRVVVQP